MRTLRTILNKNRRDRSINDEVRATIGTASVKSKINEPEMRWMGHLDTMKEEIITTKRLNRMKESRKSRMRKRWKDGEWKKI